METLDKNGNIKMLGNQGISGFSGSSGFSGASGKSGFSGLSGFSGIGTSGFSGTGTSGFSGSSGFSGGVADGSIITVTNTIQEGVTTSFADLTFNTNSVLVGADFSHSTSVNTNRIVINNPGNFVISYQFIMQNGKLATAQIKKNGATVLAGSTMDGTLGPASTSLYAYTFTANLVAGDYITLNMKSASNDNAENISMSVARNAAGPSGFSGYSGAGAAILGMQWESTGAPPPDVGFLNFDTNAAFASVATIWISRFTDSSVGSVDYFNLLSSLTPGSTIYMTQNKGASTALYTISAIVNPAPAYFTLSVSLINSSGPMFTPPFAPPFPGLVNATFSIAGSSGFSGFSGKSGVSGFSGYTGISGFSGLVNSTLLTAFKTADTSRANNSTPTTDPDLTVNIIAGKNYSFVARLQLTVPSAADLSLYIGGTASATTFSCVQNYTCVAGFTTGQEQLTTYPQSTYNSSVSVLGGATTGLYAVVGGALHCSVSGTLAVFWAQFVSNGSPTVIKAGSSFVVTPL